MASNGVDPNEGYPLFPETDAPQLGADYEEVAAFAAFRGNLPVGTTTERNAWAYAKEGSFWSNTTTDTIDRYDGSGWATFAGSGTYTPTLTGITVGNGTSSSRWSRVGSIVSVQGSFTFGSTSAVTGTVSVSLPVTAAAFYGTAATNYDVGNSTFLDVGAQLYYGRVSAQASTTAFYLYRQVVSGSAIVFGALSATLPHTWSTGDIISWTFTYTAA